MKDEPATNHIFVDFENVHDIDLTLIGERAVRLTLLVGAGQHRLPTDLVEKLIRHPAEVDLIRLKSPGKNALDFALAYHLGTAATRDPKGYFHIVSKDTGFDPLIAHLRESQIRAHRHHDFSTLTLSVPPGPAPKADTLYDCAVNHLRTHARNRPKQKKALARYLKSLSGTNATDPVIHSLIQRLTAANHLSIDPNDAVVYTF